MKTEITQTPGEAIRVERRGHVIQPDDLVPDPDLGPDEIEIEQGGFVFRNGSDSEQPAK